MSDFRSEHSEATELDQVLAWSNEEIAKCQGSQLSWLAFCYVDGVLAPEQMKLFEDRLCSDSIACDAVANVVQAELTIYTTNGNNHAVMETQISSFRKSSRLWIIPLIAVALVLMIAFLVLPKRLFPFPKFQGPVEQALLTPQVVTEDSLVSLELVREWAGIRWGTEDWLEPFDPEISISELEESASIRAKSDLDKEPELPSWLLIGTGGLN